MNINEAIRVLHENLNLKTQVAADSSVRFDVNEVSEQRFYLSQKNCLEVAQAFMVLAANIEKSEVQ